MTERFTVPTRTNLLWLAVDLDGTLAEPWALGDEPSSIGDPILRNVRKARRAFAADWKIIIHTSRPWADYELIESWLNCHHVPFDRIVCGKLMARAYIDDRNISIDAASWIPETT